MTEMPLLQPDRGQDAIAHPPRQQGRVRELGQVPLRSAAGGAGGAEVRRGSGYQTAILPDGDGWFAVGGVADPDNLSSWCMAKLAEVLPEGTYRRAGGEPGLGAARLADRAIFLHSLPSQRERRPARACC